MRTSLFFATPRTKDVERRPCPTNIHTYTLFSFPHFMGVSRLRYPFVILMPLFFFCLFLSSFGYKRLRDESSFRPEPLRTSPHEPSRVDFLMKKYINNSLHLARKYARIFVRGHYLLREANCELRGTDNV